MIVKAYTAGPMDLPDGTRSEPQQRLQVDVSLGTAQQLAEALRVVLARCNVNLVCDHAVLDARDQLCDLLDRLQHALVHPTLVKP